MFQRWYKEVVIKKLVFLFGTFLILIILNNNIVFAKLSEKIVNKYQTKIGLPVLNVIAEEKKIITNLENLDSEEFYFTVQNWNENSVSSMSYYYEIQIDFGDDDINFQVWDLNKNERINFTNNKSDMLYMDLKKTEIKYKLVVDVLNSNITKTTNINLNIVMVYKERIGEE